MAAHESPRTTKLTGLRKRLTLDEIERIRLYYVCGRVSFVVQLPMMTGGSILSFPDGGPWANIFVHDLRQL